jgi:hypothetical protein
MFRGHLIWRIFMQICTGDEVRNVAATARTKRDEGKNSG